MNNKQRHVLNVLVENRFGELARVIGLFSGRGFNIDSLTVNETLEPRFSKITLVTRGDDQIIEQIIKQIHKLIRVRRVHQVTEHYIERELCLVTVQAVNAQARDELERLVRLVGARVVAYAPSRFTIELTAPSEDVDNFLEMVRPLGIREMSRSAPIAVPRPAAEPESSKGPRAA